MKKLRAGVIGLGLIGKVHVEAIRRVGYADVLAACEVSEELTKSLSIERHYKNYDDLINDPEIDVIHNCTPNHLHFDVLKKVIAAGKPVFTEKPLAMDSKESLEIVRMVEAKPVPNAINFNYRMYPHIQDMRGRIKDGELGRINIVKGEYVQDWLFFETDYNWRLEAAYSGPSRAISDIGSHWCDMAQVLVGSRITEVFADKETFIPVRKKLLPNGGYEDVSIDTEDYAAVLLKFANGTRGSFVVSQISAGRKNYFGIEIYGSKASMEWNQENGDKLWLGYRDKGNVYSVKSPDLMTDEAKKYAYYPSGHPEGWADSARNNVRFFYDDVINGTNTGTYARIKDGHNIMLIIDAILLSAKTQAWQKVEQI
jgi:predicted dehydrogenase